MKNLLELAVNSIKKSGKKADLFNNIISSEEGQKISENNLKKDARKNNFFLISKIPSEKIYKKEIFFIDGGNSEIIGGPIFSIHLIKTCTLKFCEKKRVESQESNFHCLAIKENEKLKLFSEPEKDFLNDLETELNIQDIKDIKDKKDKKERKDKKWRKERKQNYRKEAFSEILESARRLSELNSVLSLIRNTCDEENKYELEQIKDESGQINYESNNKEGLFKGKIIVIDGSKEAFFEKEIKFINEIINESEKNEDITIWISKTTSLKHKSGLPAAFVIGNYADEMGLKGPWFWKLDQDYKKEIYEIEESQEIQDFNKNQEIQESSLEQHEKFVTGFVKFSSDSKNIFRIDYLSSQEKMFLESLSLIIQLSSDPVFPGYPYGLIEADQEARVTNEEIEELRAELYRLKPEDMELLEKISSSSDAHKILDKIRF